MDETYPLAIRRTNDPFKTSKIQVMTDPWNPSLYGRFADERALPFHELLALVTAGALGRAVDLGCGSGSLTALAVDRLDVGTMEGIDSSAAMLDDARLRERPGRLSFRAGDIAEWTSAADVDLVLANASLQWVGDHPAVLARWTAALAPGGQLAVQVPANADHASHLVAAEVAGEPEFADHLPTGAPPDPVAANVLLPEQYADLLYGLGFDQQRVALRVYPHVLPSVRSVVDWVRGTTLTRFERELPPEVFERFVERYRERLLARLGEHSPYLYTFKRILIWGRRPTG